MKDRRTTIQLDEIIHESTENVSRFQKEVSNKEFEVRHFSLSDAVWYCFVSVGLVCRQFGKTMHFFLQR